MHLEGCPVAVAQTVVLPAQPAVGTLTYVPLGGDGFSSPFAAYGLKIFQASGDVSGGALTMNVNFDPRFCSLVAYVTVQIAQGTSADADVRIQVRGDTIATVNFQGPVSAVASDVTSFEVAHTFAPVPVIVPGAGENGAIQVAFDNVDGDEYFLDTLIYLFNIRVRELTPMGPLLWARGST